MQNNPLIGFLMRPFRIDKSYVLGSDFISVAWWRMKTDARALRGAPRLLLARIATTSGPPTDRTDEPDAILSDQFNFFPARAGPVCSTASRKHETNQFYRKAKRLLSPEKPGVVNGVWWERIRRLKQIARSLIVCCKLG